MLAYFSGPWEALHDATGMTRGQAFSVRCSCRAGSLRDIYQWAESIEMFPGRVEVALEVRERRISSLSIAADPQFDSCCMALSKIQRKGTTDGCYW